MNKKDNVTFEISFPTKPKKTQSKVEKNKNDKVKALSQEERSDLLNRSKAREIVKEIMDFGVSQSQIIYIIRLLALELEDVHVMNKINAFVEESERFHNEATAKISDVNDKTKIYT